MYHRSQVSAQKFMPLAFTFGKKKRKKLGHHIITQAFYKHACTLKVPRCNSKLIGGIPVFDEPKLL